MRCDPALDQAGGIRTTSEELSRIYSNACPSEILTPDIENHLRVRGASRPQHCAWKVHNYNATRRPLGTQGVTPGASSMVRDEAPSTDQHFAHLEQSIGTELTRVQPCGEPVCPLRPKQIGGPGRTPFHGSMTVIVFVRWRVWSSGSSHPGLPGTEGSGTFPSAVPVATPRVRVSPTTPINRFCRWLLAACLILSRRLLAKSTQHSIEALLSDQRARSGRR